MFYLSDHLAFRGMMALQSAGLSVPDPVGVVEFDALAITGFLPSALTTLHAPRHQTGVISVSDNPARIQMVIPNRAVRLRVRVITGATTCHQAVCRCP